MKTLYQTDFWKESRVSRGAEKIRNFIGYCSQGEMIPFIQSLNTYWVLTDWMHKGRNKGPWISKGDLWVNAFQEKCFLIELPMPSPYKRWHFLFHVNKFTNKYFHLYESLSKHVQAKACNFTGEDKCVSRPVGAGGVRWSEEERKWVLF